MPYSAPKASGVWYVNVLEFWIAPQKSNAGEISKNAYIYMKHTHNHDNIPDAGHELLPVRFEFTHPSATTVCIAGTFNQWQPAAKPMHPLGNGQWLKESALAAGTYEYCLVVDGQWMPDPRAQESVPNPFGGRNSVLKVIKPPN
jgi:1,4-alpha-glucan branching enzyme